MRDIRGKTVVALVIMIMLTVHLSIFNQNTEGTNSVSNNISSNMDIIGRFKNNNTMNHSSFGSFVENLGQYDSNIHFTSNKGEIAFCPDRILYNIRDEQLTKGCIVSLKFNDANTVIPEGVEKLSYQFNYFHGDDSLKYINNVNNYKVIKYVDLWEGIDLIYRVVPDGVKYEFNVHPEGDPDDISIKVTGHSKLFIDSDDLVISPFDGVYIRDSNLLSYDLKTGKTVYSRFEIEGDVLSFEIEDYVKNHGLVIDPLIQMSLLGGYGECYSVALDDDGNQYLTGYTHDKSFPTTEGSYSLNKYNYSDIFVTKMNSNGTSLIYSTFIGGNGQDMGRDIDVDRFGNVYVSGQTGSYAKDSSIPNSPILPSDFPVTENAYDTSFNGQKDAVVFKLSPNGSKLLFSTFIGGSNSDISTSLALDPNRRIFISGFTNSSQFPVTSNSYQTTHNLHYDGFILCLNKTGEKIDHSTYLGGDYFDMIYGIDIDWWNNIYVCGYTNSTNYPMSHTISSGKMDNYDVIVSKLNSNLSSLIFSTVIGGEDRECARDIKVDDQNNPYVTGYTYSQSTSSSENITHFGFPVSDDAYDKTYNGGGDVFLFKLRSDGSKMIFSTYIGDEGMDWAFGLDIDSSGNSYVTGWTDSDKYPTTFDALQKKNANNYSKDIFMTKINNDGSQLLYSTMLGGTNDDIGWDICLDSNNDIFISGCTKSKDFPTANKTYNSTKKGFQFSCLILKMDCEGVYPPSTPLNLEAELNSDCSNLTWEPPTFLGTGGKVDHYKVYKENDYSSPPFMEEIGTTVNTPYIDHNIVVGENHMYAVSAVGKYGESRLSNIAVATDREPPIIRSTTNSSALSGEPFVFSANITDNVKVKEVWVEFWFEEGPRKNRTMEKNGEDWTKTIDIGTSENRDIFFKITAFDYYDHNSVLGPITVSLLSNLPYFSTDHTPSVATTGDPFTFSVEITDNKEVKGAYVSYGYGDGEVKNLSMLRGKGNVWTKTIRTKHTLEQIKYGFHAFDNLGNWNEAEEKTIDMIDNDLPWLHEDNTPLFVDYDSRLLFKAIFEDNTELSSSAYVEYWFNDGKHRNISMIIENERFVKEISIPATGVNVLHYLFHFSDISGNWNSTYAKDILIIDDQDPAIISDLSSEEAYAGRIFIFRTTAIDNIHVKKMYVRYQIGDGLILNSSMEFIKGEWRLKIQVPNVLEEINYRFWAVDESGRTGSNKETSVIIKDIDPPQINTESVPSVIASGSDLELIVNVSDNIEVSEVFLKYHLGNQDYSNSTLSGANPYTRIIKIPEDFIGFLRLLFQAVDSSGNWNLSKLLTIEVKDEQPPVLHKDMSPRVGRSNEDFTFIIRASDNVKIDEVKVEYWYGNQDHETGQMFQKEDEFSYSMAIASGPDKLHYKIHIIDTSGNIYTSDEKEIEIEDGFDLDGSILRLLLALIIIILIVLIFFVFHKRRSGPDNFQDGRVSVIHNEKERSNDYE